MGKLIVKFLAVCELVNQKYFDRWAKMLWSGLSRALKVLFDWIPLFAVLITPYITAVLFVIMYYKRGNIFEIGIEWVYPLLMHAFVFFLVEYKDGKKKESTKKDSIPVARKRYTYKDGFGNVIVREEDLHEALQYLNTLEDFAVLRRNGMIGARNIVGCFMATIILSAMLCAPVHAAPVTIPPMDAEEENLLHSMAVAEAGNQGIGGMAFVMQVVFNRVASDSFPDTVGGVVSQPGQFEPYTDGSYQNYGKTDNSQKALELCGILENTGALYFQNEDIASTGWISKNCEYLFEHIDHTFYK